MNPTPHELNDMTIAGGLFSSGLVVVRLSLELMSGEPIMWRSYPIPMLIAFATGVVICYLAIVARKLSSRYRAR